MTSPLLRPGLYALALCAALVSPYAEGSDAGAAVAAPSTTAARQPVLVVNGDADRLVPTVNSYDLAKRLPNSQLVIYPDAGHGGVFQYEEDFVPKALAFLAN